jgi:hypothetical protein
MPNEGWRRAPADALATDALAVVGLLAPSLTEPSAGVVDAASYQAAVASRGPSTTASSEIDAQISPVVIVSFLLLLLYGYKVPSRIRSLQTSPVKALGVTKPSFQRRLPI